MKVKSTGILECTDKKISKLVSQNSFSNLTFSRIISGLLEDEQHNSSKMSQTPPEMIIDTSVCTKSSEPARPKVEEGILDSQD